jgi:invasion protein IalB
MRLILVVLFGTIAASPCWAQQQTPAPSPTNRPDSNRVVCEEEEQIGTRLGDHKVCMTVHQWEERRSQARDNTDRVQQNVYAPKSSDPQ